MRGHRHRVFVIAIAIALPLVIAPAAQAQQPARQPAQQRVSIDFRDTPLRDVLQAVEDAGDVPHIALPDIIGDMRVTVSLVDVPLADALTTILGQMGLVAVGGGYATTVREATRDEAEWARWRAAR